MSRNQLLSWLLHLLHKYIKILNTSQISYITVEFHIVLSLLSLQFTRKSMRWHDLYIVLRLNTCIYIPRRLSEWSLFR